MFKLMKNEQRLLVLLMLALLTAAFIRYWRDARSPYAPKLDQPSPAAMPSSSPANLGLEDDEAASADEHRPWPSPHSSP